MPHKNTVFHAILATVPWLLFARLVAEHSADKHVRRLSTKTQFLALLYGQLSGASSLRGVISSFASHVRRLYHLGAQPVARSSLSDANAQRPSAVFSALFAALVARVQPKLARAVGECILLIEQTVVSLNRHSETWAHFSAGVCGAKVHVVYDADAECPIYAAVTPQRTNDITAAKAMVPGLDPGIQGGATYVFDLGYYDYGWWAKLDAAGCRIVTRFKSNTPLSIESERLIAPGGPILSDRTGYLPARMAGQRQNPMHKLVREVRVRIETGRILRILSNDLTASAQQIAELYKRRWAIEQVFRVMKTKGFDIEASRIADNGPFENLATAVLIASIQVMQMVRERDGAAGRPAIDVFDAAEQPAIVAISAGLEGKTQRQKNPHPPGTLAHATWVCARLGGWTGYYGKPGPFVIHSGFVRLRHMLHGWALGKDVRIS